VPKSLALRVRRDRHGHGARGPVIPHSAPIHETADELFERLLTEAVSDVNIRLGRELASVEIMLEEIPNLRDLTLAQENVPLGRVEIANPSKVVIYQKPIQQRADTKQELDRLIRDTLAELISLIIGIRAVDIDPNYEGRN
jgi:predicted Zn-dependent protease with MMP-like domain